MTDKIFSPDHLTNKVTEQPLNKEKEFWNGTVLGMKINEKIQELCQEYWEAGFNTGSMFSKQSIQEFLKELKSLVLRSLSYNEEIVLNRIDAIAKQKFGDKLL